MNHAVQLPLALNFRFASQAKLFPAFIGSYIGKDWLYCRHSMAINVLTIITVRSGLLASSLMLALSGLAYQFVYVGLRLSLMVKETCRPAPLRWFAASGFSMHSCFKLQFLHCNNRPSKKALDCPVSLKRSPRKLSFSPAGQ